MRNEDRRSVEIKELTRSQLMIWTGQRLQPEDPLYNMALSFRIDGPIDASAFRAAFQTLVNNCDALRTTFELHGDEPRQHVHARIDYDVELVDLSASADVEAALDKWQRERAKRRFDTARCLYESTLVKLAAERYVWFLNQHHLITDAWSTALIYRTMGHYYDLALAGRLDDAEALPAFGSYVDYETKQRDSRVMRNAAAYWRQRLAVPVSASSFYRATPRDRTRRTDRMACSVGVQRSQKIHALAESEGFQEFSTELARFQIFATTLFAWLRRVTGNSRLTIGTPSHNRGLSSHKKTVGLFIEIYPLRVEIEDRETFRSLYGKVARGIKELLINAPSGASGFEHNRAYDVLLNYITASFGDFNGMPMASEWVHADHGDRNHLLRMQVEDFDNLDHFRVFFDLNVDTFVGDERLRPGQQFVRMLDAFIANPDLALSQVDLLEVEERADLEKGCAANETPRPVPTETVYDMFRRQAKAAPDRVAIRCDDSQFSYAELVAASDGLACRLRTYGIERGARVAIALPRSIEAVVAMLAVLRCGAAYVPVDPTYPEERIAYMLDDAAVPLVLTNSGCAPGLPAEVSSILLDEPPDNSVDATEELAWCSEVDDTAYVIYTSGSTGQPKGVDVAHRGLANYVSWAASYYLAGEALDWPLFSSLSFDLTVTSIFVPLVSGGSIVVYPESEDRREIAIRRVVEDDAVDIVKLTPAHLSLLQAMDLSSLRLRKLVVGGEDFKADLARSVSSYFGDDVDIYNEYGPTEGTVACMIHRFDPETDVGASVPIGRAIDNAYVYVLDDGQRLQPRGVVGELCIGGVGVANGYLNRDDLTKERFVDNPFRSGESLYRTGDLARLNSDGTLTCLGRYDTQVKISGVRIEPGEIEAALLAHPDITETAVRLFDKASGDVQQDERFCVRCGLSDKHPGAILDDAGICRLCRSYQMRREQARAYFRTPQDLRQIVEEAKRHATGEQDSMMLLSGGKDSTYALCQLVDLGLTPLVFTLDNGYISEGAKANIRRVVDQLGLELVVGSTPAMNEIFVDSLRRFSNVCNGCFKTIYTLSMKIARERGIRYIFTGLSRGQIFETRVQDLFRRSVFDPAQIDATIVEARKAYHRADDAVSRLLDVRHLQDESIFEEVEFVDFYRYSEVSLDEMLRYLSDRVPWVRPADTGRSTNCLINEAGIHVHKQERGYHNYALPYSWDVRLGHKERDAAREELDDDINVDNVQRILTEIGYRPRAASLIERRRRFLAAYFVSAQPIDAAELKDWLSQRLPKEFIPSHFVRLDRLPLTPNGKLDRDALPEPDLSRPNLAEAYVPPTGQHEAALVDIWAEVLGVDRVGVNDNFFELGGDSIMNIQIVSLAMKRGLQLSPQQVFDHPTVAELARVVDQTGQVASEQGPVTGDVPLTPIQRRFFESAMADRKRSSQYVILEGSAELDLLVLEEALRLLIAHHDGLRSRYVETPSGWRQTLLAADEIKLSIARPEQIAGADPLPAIRTYAESVPDDFDLEKGPLIRAAVFESSAKDRSFLLLSIHHLLVDAVSWWVLADDLDRAYRELTAGDPVKLPPKTTSIKQWSRTLEEFAASAQVKDSLGLWRLQSGVAGGALGSDSGLDGENDLASVATHTLVFGTEDTTRLTSHVAARSRIQTQDLLLAALTKTLWEWSGQAQHAVDVESHGREPISEEIDLLRTVGWFTSIYPIRLEYRHDEDPVECLRRVRDSLRQIPDGGLGYGALRYLSADQEVRSSLACAERSQVLFNYLGKWRRDVCAGEIFQFSNPVSATSPRVGKRRHLIEINASVFEGRLRLDWTYSRNVHRDATITTWAERFRDILFELTTCCIEKGDLRLSPADFPAADLSQDELDDILAEFGDAD